MLDTNICIAWLKNRSIVAERVIAAGENQVFLCSPVKSELWYGACRSQRVKEHQAALLAFFVSMATLPFDDEAALRCGELRAHLARRGTPIGPYDIQIAAIGLTHGMTVVTNNVAEFSRVPDIRIEDWLIRT
nr:type II toxin-antitoxin system VapC family toxin [Thiorhodococcus mannitoliphagus]